MSIISYKVMFVVPYISGGNENKKSFMTSNLLSNFDNINPRPRRSSGVNPYLFSPLPPN